MTAITGGKAVQFEREGEPAEGVPAAIDILGVPVTPLTMRGLIDRCVRAVEHRQPLSLGMLNVAKLVTMVDDAVLREAVLTSDLIVADGMGVVWGSRLLGRPLPERVAGIDVFTELLAEGDRRGFSVYLLGARQPVIEQVERLVRSRHPNLRIAGARNGYFDDSEEAGIVETIAASKPDMLFLGMTSPKKELFLARWGERLGVPVSHGVGGSFDVLAGVTKRAPESWQRLGLEWLYRLLQEPRRMFRRYAVTNTRFAWMLVHELFGGQRGLR